MADGVFNIAKGAVAEKVRDDPTKIGVALLKVAQADATLADHDTWASIKAAANTEADFTNYVALGKYPVTATIFVDDPNERVDVDIPDQTWVSAGGASNNTLVKLIVYYQESAADSGRIPLTHHDFAVTTDGSDLSCQIASAGFYRAS